ncbi:MAG: hypothetical protein LKJ90_07160 [Faecalibacterium sp.]|jgi:hypothetical protein|nr:hypothetical protein [Faecalibacterium sp.]
MAVGSVWMAALLLISLLGWFSFWRRASGLHWAFAPVLAVSCIALAVFGAGLLNILVPVVWAVFLAGLFFALREGVCLAKAPKAWWAAYPKAWLVLAGLWGYFYAFFAGQQLVGSDNFSHWGLVVKTMLRYDRFPNFSNAGYLDFQSYPLGSSSFLYYVCRLISGGEGCMIFAQSILTLAALFTLCAFVQKRRALQYGVVAFAALCIWTSSVTYYSGVSDLLVDTLLAVYAIALLAFFFCYRDALAGKILWLAPLSCMITIIKNSGGLFPVFVCLGMLLTLRRQHALKTCWKPWLITTLAPFALLYLWERHVAFSFAQGAATEHSLSLSRFEAVFGEKTAADIAAISSAFFKNVLNLYNPAFEALAVLLALWVASLFIKGLPDKGFYACAAAMGTVLWAVYTLGLLGMYWFSMPLEDALPLASFARYDLTLAEALLGLCVIAALRMADTLLETRFTRGWWLGAAAAALVVFCCAYSFKPTPAKLVVPRAVDSTESGAQRVYLEALLAKTPLPDGAKCIVYRPDTLNNRYAYYLVRYTLLSGDIKVVGAGDLDTLSLAGYDYFLCTASDDTIEAYYTAHFGTSDTSRAVTLAKVS